LTRTPWMAAQTVTDLDCRDVNRHGQKLTRLWTDIPIRLWPGRTVNHNGYSLLLVRTNAVGNAMTKDWYHLQMTLTSCIVNFLNSPYLLHSCLMSSRISWMAAGFFYKIHQSRGQRKSSFWRQSHKEISTTIGSKTMFVSTALMLSWNEHLQFFTVLFSTIGLDPFFLPYSSAWTATSSSVSLLYCRVRLLFGLL